MFEPTQDPTAITLILVLVVLSAIWLEENTKAFKKMGAAALTILLGMLLSNIGVIPGESAVYDFFRGPGVLAGIILCLLSVNLSSLKDAGSPMLKAFLLGAIGATLGAAVMGYLLVDSIGSDTWKLSGQFAATYIGGGVNFAAVGQALGTSSEYFTAGVAADVIVTAIWLIICITVPEYFGKRRSATSSKEDNGLSEEEIQKNKGIAALLHSSGTAVVIMDLALLLSIVMVCLWFSDVMAAFIPKVPSILWLTTMALVLAQLPFVKKISGGLVFGNYLLLLFLATNGAISIVAKIIEIGPSIFYFALGTVLIHGVIIFGVGIMLKIDSKILAIASQANIGGASSAMAIAGARGVPQYILPGVAVGLFGMAIGNYIGLFLANLMRATIGG